MGALQHISTSGFIFSWIRQAKSRFLYITFHEIVITTLVSVVTKAIDKDICYLSLEGSKARSLLRLLSVDSCAVLFSLIWLGRLRCFQLGSWFWISGEQRRMVQMRVWKRSSHASLCSTFPPTVLWIGAVWRFYMLMLSSPIQNKRSFFLQWEDWTVYTISSIS